MNNLETGKKGVFDWYFKSNLLIRIFLGLVLGALAGIIFGEKIAWVKPLGSVLVNLLKMIVMPVILSTLVVGAASIKPSALAKSELKLSSFIF